MWSFFGVCSISIERLLFLGRFLFLVVSFFLWACRVFFGLLDFPWIVSFELGEFSCGLESLLGDCRVSLTYDSFYVHWEITLVIGEFPLCIKSFFGAWGVYLVFWLLLGAIIFPWGFDRFLCDWRVSFVIGKFTKCLNSFQVPLEFYLVLFGKFYFMF